MNDIFDKFKSLRRDVDLSSNKKTLIAVKKRSNSLTKSLKKSMGVDKSIILNAKRENRKIQLLIRKKAKELR